MSGIQEPGSLVMDDFARKEQCNNHNHYYTLTYSKRWYRRSIQPTIRRPHNNENLERFKGLIMDISQHIYIEIDTSRRTNYF